MSILIFGLNEQSLSLPALRTGLLLHNHQCEITLDIVPLVGERVCDGTVAQKPGQYCWSGTGNTLLKRQSATPFEFHWRTDRQTDVHKLQFDRWTTSMIGLKILANQSTTLNSQYESYGPGLVSAGSGTWQSSQQNHHISSPIFGTKHAVQICSYLLCYNGETS